MAFSLFRKKDNDPARPTPSGPATLSRPSVLPEVEHAPAPAPSPMDAPADSASYNLSELMIEVEDAGEHLSPAEEEAVVLYANGQLAAAIDSLKAALPALAGSRQTSSWLLMFDLLQLAGDHAAFDDLALQYVVEFETSPPVWREMRSKPVTQAAGTSAGLVTMPAELNSSSVQNEAVKILKASENGGQVRIDFSRVNSLDVTAAAELLSLWPRARKLKASLQILGADHLGALLAGKIETGRRNHAEAPFWLLLMEVKQTVGDQESFDNLAIDYAVTFEVSPPSWDTKLVVKSAPAPAGNTASASQQAAVTDRLALTGDLTGGAAETMSKIRHFANEHGKPVLDFSAVSRVDFESAGQMLNVGVELMQAGKTPTIVGANEPIAGLFKLMGITELMPLSKG
ncbi:hypothetical protein IGB42_03562 [Andreprevotia sp. IGB-42]|uniref:hypothetical protein n=1 Tax=Andreprevotia sp. IGB-42 TaxID=2497473 RepID=UPI00135A3AC8|nr:hypothetical protein [Andreprevotia sp. IGB-42]KAF0812020.1 hypothetical protein IGB42_03562 [Andreprevotia sp. IGB-42]